MRSQIPPASGSNAVPRFWQYLDPIFSFRGRVNRLYWWAGSSLLWVYSWVGAALIAVPQLMEGGLNGERMMLAYLFWVVGFLMMASAVYFWLALNAKRWHDLDRSGWWNLTALVPVVNLWFAVELAFFRGTAGPNRYGSTIGDDDLAFAIENALRVIAWAGILALVVSGVVWLASAVSGRA